MKVDVHFMFTGIPSNQGRLSLDLAEHTTVGAMLENTHSVNGYPFAHSLIEGSMFIVNKVVVDLDTELKDGDSVMIIRTLGGG